MPINIDIQDVSPYINYIVEVYNDGYDMTKHTIIPKEQDWDDYVFVPCNLVSNSTTTITYITKYTIEGSE